MTDRPRQVGVFLPNWVGDAAMATPAMRALRKRFGPEAHLIGVMRPHVADLLAGTKWLNENVLYHPKSKKREYGNLAVLGQLRERKLDEFILMPNSFRSGLLAWLSGAKKRIGYVRYGRGPLLTKKLIPPERGRKTARFAMVDYYLKLAYAAGCRSESPHLELATTAADEAVADRVWLQLGLRNDGRIVTLNCSGAFGAAKLWPPEHFAALGRRIADELDHDVLIICGPQERMTAEVIVESARHPRVFSLAGQALSIGLSKVCVKRSRAFVTTDSGPRQFAVAFDVPIVSLFGPTHPIWGQNPCADELALRLDIDCIDCHGRTCPLEHHRCMRDLTVDRVFRAVAHQVDFQRLPIAA